MTWSDKPRSLLGIIADDLTGQNGTCILLRRRGFRTASLTGMDWPDGGLAGYDCVAVNTDSRALPAAEARSRVVRAAEMIMAHKGRPVAKRIDSTLRGILGPEIEALLGVLGPNSVAVVTGAFPSSGRTTRDGMHYVGGTLLEETAVRHDPLCPITESHLPTLLAKQTQLTVGQLPLATVREGAEAVARALRQLAQSGVRMICPDAETNDDITALGVGMVLSGLTVIAADPGPLTAAYAGALMAQRHRRVMVVCGSVSSNTRQQIEKLERDLGAALVTVDAGALAEGGASSDAEVQRVVAELTALPNDRLIIGVTSSELMSLPGHKAGEAIAAGFAEIAAQMLGAVSEIAGLYTSGGDVTLAVCRRLGSKAINVVEEVIPLAVAGRLLGGQYPGLPIVTKGGLVGGPDAAVLCVNQILKEVQNHD